MTLIRNHQRDTLTKRFAVGLALAVGIHSGTATAQLIPCSRELPSECFTVSTSPDAPLALETSPLAIATDGRFLVYMGGTDSTSRLYVRALGESLSRVLNGTEGARRPTFSPDGNWIAFFAAGELRKISRDGGEPIVLARGVSETPVTWTPDNRIIVPTTGLTGGRRGLSQISASGGEPKPITVSDSFHNKRHWNPLLLSDNSTLLFVDQGPGGFDDDYLAIGSADGGDFTVLDVHASKPLGYTQGYAVFSADGKIMAVPLDIQRRTATGPPVLIMEGLTNDHAVSLSWNGTLVYANSTVQLVWVDEKGKHRNALQERANYGWPRISPDGTQIAVTVTGATYSDVRIHHMRTGNSTSLDTRDAERPEWSPDGKRVLFMVPYAPAGLWWRPVDVTGPAEPVGATVPGNSNFASEGVVSPDGKTILFRVQSAGTGRDLHYLTVGAAKEATPWLVTPANEVTPRFSPDGNWVAYASDESGRYEVYARPFRGVGGPYRISDAGGEEPVWSRNGRRIYYSTGGQMMVTEVTTSKRLVVRSRKSLFAWRALPGFGHANYDVGPDGKLLMLFSSDDESRMVVVTNLFDKLRAKVSRGK